MLLSCIAQQLMHIMQSSHHAGCLQTHSPVPPPHMHMAVHAQMLPPRLGIILPKGKLQIDWSEFHRWRVRRLALARQWGFTQCLPYPVYLQRVIEDTSKPHQPRLNSAKKYAEAMRTRKSANLKQEVRAQMRVIYPSSAGKA
eukprot:scaffold73638_cov27-Tisochrysis_lutea.AAC.1